MKNVFVPEGARCCTDHFVNNQLKGDANDIIKPSSVQDMYFTAGDVRLLIDGWQMIFQQQKRFDFDSLGYLSEDDCETMIGLSKIQFEDLIQHFSSSNLRDSSNRSARTAIAILLCKLRLGISNRLLATLFQLPNQRVVSSVSVNRCHSMTQLVRTLSSVFSFLSCLTCPLSLCFVGHL